jgi:hypothetical protein
MASSEITRICVQRLLPEHHDYYHSIKDDDKLSAAFWSSKLWPQNSTVTIGFLDNPTSANQRTPLLDMQKIGRHIDPLQKVLANSPLKEAVKTIVDKRIQPLVNLKLKFVDSNPEAADIRITFKDAGASWSNVGTDSKKYSSKNCKSKENKSCVQPSMNLGWFDVGTYIHEFGHALGMIHEHQNPRGQNIDWNIPKLMSYMEETQGWDKQQVQTNVINRYNIDQINGSDFDPLSVMLYFFPASLTNNNKGTKQNFSLSGIDAEWISKSYPGGPMSPSDFFQQAYGHSLESSVKESKKLQSMNSNGNWGFILVAIVFGVILLVGLILLILLKFVKRNK